MFTFMPEAPFTAFQFPEDAIAGQSAFIKAVRAPDIGYLRAYALTDQAVADAMVEAVKAGYQRNAIVDHSQMEDPSQQGVVNYLISGGVYITISTSTAGVEYISHEKTWVDASGYVYTGSTNWSDSAWKQTNKSLIFVSTIFRDKFIADFQAQVEFAWTKEASFQLMNNQPPSVLNA